jgi:hypothetical protein
MWSATAEGKAMDWKHLLAYITGTVDQELLRRNAYLVTENRLILKRHGLPPAPERKKTATLKEFIRTHLNVLVATDFFTAEAWTLGGLVTYYVLFFLHLGSRQVHVAGVTPHPHAAWMIQIARHVTMTDWGFLTPGQYLIHDRDGKFCPAFQRIIDDTGVTRIPLPPQSPALNAYAEWWVAISQWRGDRDGFCGVNGASGGEQTIL